MKILDLFAGIGGFSLAAHWMGWETAAFVEWEEYPQKVLKKNFPNVPIYGDIKEFNGKEYTGTVDLICGGFPCQPFSVAGKRKGASDDRYLWPEMLRVIREVQPTWVIGENVAGIETMEDGRTFEEICTSLESEGYEVQPFDIPAGAIGAWHRRHRIWFLAYSLDNANKRRRRKEEKKKGIQGVDRQEGCTRQLIGTDSSFYSDSNSIGNEGKWEKEIPKLKGLQRVKDDGIFANIEGRPDLSTPVICRSYDGISGGMDRLKALGNSIVPQVAYEIFKAIDQCK